jgi:hypothetical protein
MEAVAVNIPQPRALRAVKPGRRARSDVFRPAICPDGHVGRIRVDRIQPNGPFHSRAGYRCSYWGVNPKTGVWGEVRHRFTDRSPIDPLPRRHPTHEHSYSQDNCPTCEHQYAPDEGPRVGRRFYYTAADVTSVLLNVGTGDPIRLAAAAARRNALRYRPKTRSHRPAEREPTPEDLDWFASVVAVEDLGLGHPVADLEDTDWDVRFRGGLGEDDYQADDWRDEPDQAPSDAELLRAYADTFIDHDESPQPVPTPAEMVDQERYLSKSFALGGEYVDVFGPAVVAPHHVSQWPEAIVIDSLPIRRRALVQQDDRARVASDFLCEIFGVQDAKSKELILLYPAGGKDQESIREVFAQKEGAPIWIVTDGDAAMPIAIRNVFPGAIHYRCEEHLRDDARDAAKKDKVDDPDVLAAIGDAQFSPAHWEHLKAIVAVKVEKRRRALRNWIEMNEDLVLSQCHLRRLHPGYPRSTGGVEPPLAKVSHYLETRRVALRSRRRLLIVLELMRVALIHRARPERYTLIVRQQLEAGRRARVDWKSHWDEMIRDERGVKKPRNTLIDYRNMARERNALAREDEARAQSARLSTQRMDAAMSQARADGGQPTNRVRRTTGRAGITRPGDRIADVPQLMKFWDFSKNAGKDPTVLLAHSRDVHDWVCREHENGDPDGLWPGHLHEWRQSAAHRAAKGAGCRFCMRRKPCAATCLRTSHPRLAGPEEWDYTTNDAADVTPDTVLSGSHTSVSWICKKHGIYPMEIRARALLGQSCTPCSGEAGAEKRRATMRAKAKERHAMATRARDRAASTPGEESPR